MWVFRSGAFWVEGHIYSVYWTHVWSRVDGSKVSLTFKCAFAQFLYYLCSITLRRICVTSCVRLWDAVECPSLLPPLVSFVLFFSFCPKFYLVLILLLNHVIYYPRICSVLRLHAFAMCPFTLLLSLSLLFLTPIRLFLTIASCFSFPHSLCTPASSPLPPFSFAPNLSTFLCLWWAAYFDVHSWGTNGSIYMYSSAMPAEKRAITGTLGEEAIQDAVQKYYSKHLKTSDDLPSCTAEWPPDHIVKAIKPIHPKLISKYHGCGLCLSNDLGGLSIVDLGCGAGHDVYIASLPIGPKGSVLRVDMTKEQLDATACRKVCFRQCWLQAWLHWATGWSGTRSRQFRSDHEQLRWLVSGWH